MAGSVNKVTLIGNLGKDRRLGTPSRHEDRDLTVATSDTWNDKASGERQDRTEWHRVVIMNDRLADVAERFLRKGSKVYLEGKLQTRKWTDQSGQEKYTTEVMLGRFGAELVLLDRLGRAVPPLLPRVVTVGSAAGLKSRPAVLPPRQVGTAAVAVAEISTTKFHFNLPRQTLVCPGTSARAVPLKKEHR